MLSQPTASIPVASIASSNENVASQRPAILEFSSLIGQSTAVSLLAGAIALHRVAPAYLFAGADGVGKTLAARIFIAQLFNTYNLTNHPDLLWVEPTYLHQGELVNQSELVQSEVKRKSLPQIRIEQIREIPRFLSCSPLVASCKVVVIQNAEQMASAAEGALLKTLEEPINGTIVLISSQAQKLLPTITSRCQVVPFHRLNHDEMVKVCQRLGQTEILSYPVVMSLAAGSPGKAIAYYNQLQSIPQDLLTQLSTPPTNALAAMQIAKEVDTVLEYHQQLWLLDYLLHSWWHRYHDVALAEKVEEAKTSLNKLVASRLLWEILLLPSV